MTVPVSCLIRSLYRSELYLEGATAGAKNGSQSSQSFYDCAQYSALHVVLKSFTLEHYRMNFFKISTTWSITLFFPLPLFWRTKKKETPSVQGWLYITPNHPLSSLQHQQFCCGRLTWLHLVLDKSQRASVAWGNMRWEEERRWTFQT